MRKSKVKMQKSKLNPKSKILVGLSGGVDSSVAAVLLKDQGYEVIGAFLKFWSDPKCSAKRENACCDYESLIVARSVADKLKIPFYVFDVSKEFKKEVVDYFINEYDSGRTPNPCVECNKKIKFGWMLEQAKKLGCDYAATGHYSRIVREIPSSKSQILNKFQIQNSKLRNYCLTSDDYHLFQSKDKKKDQSYFLWQLNQKQLSHIIFPIGDYTKEEVRKMAKKWKLSTAEKKESQDLCFINADITDFLSDYADKLNKPGDIVGTNGNVLGRHKGLCYYTVGQRQGIGVQMQNSKCKIQNDSLKLKNNSKKLPRPRSAKRGGQPTTYNLDDTSFQPAYVIRLNVEKNQLVVGSKEDLNSFELYAGKVNWINRNVECRIQNSEWINCQVKIRYGATLVNCHIAKLPNCYNTPSKNNVTMEQCNNVTVKFDQPQRAITPGQSIVFYLPAKACACLPLRGTSGQGFRRWQAGQEAELLGGGIIEKAF